MKGWEEHINVHKPLEEVFGYVSTFERHGEWSGHGLQATKVGDGPLAVGTKYSTTAKQFGTQKEESTITEINEPKRFGWDSVGALGRIHHQFSLLEDGVGTQLSKSVELTNPTFLAKLMGFKMKHDVPKALKADLIKIKENLERSSG